MERERVPLPAPQAAPPRAGDGSALRSLTRVSRRGVPTTWSGTARLSLPPRPGGGNEHPYKPTFSNLRLVPRGHSRSCIYSRQLPAHPHSLPPKADTAMMMMLLINLATAH